MGNYIKTLGEVVNGIASGDLAENTVLANSSGTKAVVSNGSLLWLTSAGYVSTPVSISNDTITEVWVVEKATVTKEVSFTEGVDLVAKGKTVTFVSSDDGFFEVSRLRDLEELITKDSTLDALYYGSAFYEEETVISSINADNGSVRINAGTINVGDVDITNVGKKLEGSDVHRIHHLKHFLGKTAESIALEYGISTRMVYYILDGTYWNDIYHVFHETFDVATGDYIE